MLENSVNMQQIEILTVYIQETFTEALSSLKDHV